MADPVRRQRDGGDCESSGGSDKDIIALKVAFLAKAGIYRSTTRSAALCVPAVAGNAVLGDRRCPWMPAEAADSTGFKFAPASQVMVTTLIGGWPRLKRSILATIPL